MAKSVKSSGRTVEEAIQAGLAELGVERDRVQVELLGGAGESDDQVHVQLTVREEDELIDAPIAPATPKAHEAAAAAENAPAAAQDIPALAQQVLEKLLQGMGIRSQVVIRRDVGSAEGPDFVLDIIGADLGILIGRRGETLRDLEYLTRLIVAQKVNRNLRFIVDVEGYRARRERMLRELAKRMAERVRQNRQPITLEAMPPHERRIVHLTLRDHPTVRTQSIGEGDHRRVMILPK